MFCCRNTIGNIPTNWYDEYPHIGYDLDGKRIHKPRRGDELDSFLSRMENPEHGVTVRDEQTGQAVVLSQQDADIVSRTAKNRVKFYIMHRMWKLFIYIKI